MKKEASLIAFLLSVPLASAQYIGAQQSQGGMITEGFNFLFGQTSNEIVLKLGLFILLLAVFKAGFTKLKLFEENPNMNMVLGSILALIAIKFMPTEFSSGIGTLIWVGALFVLPYLLISMFVHNTIWKVILTILSVGLIYYFISGGLGLYGSRYPYLGFIRGSEVFDDIYYQTTKMSWLVPLLLVGALILLIYLMRRGSGGTGEGGSGSGGAWSRWRDRALQKKLAKIQANKEMDIASERQYHEKELAEKEYQKRKFLAEEEANKMAVEDENKRIHERKVLGSRLKHEKEQEEAKRAHEIELEKIRRREVQQAKEKGDETIDKEVVRGPRKYMWRRRLRGRQAKEGEKGGEAIPPIAEPPKPEVKGQRPEPTWRKQEESAEPDLNRLGQIRRLGIIAGIRNKLGWKVAGNPPVPLNIRRIGVKVPEKAEQNQEGATIDKDMEDRMRRVRLQRYRQLQGQRAKNLREQEELERLRTEFGNEKQEVPTPQRITGRRTLRRIFKDEKEREEARRRVDEYKEKKAKADRERKGLPPNPNAALMGGRWKEAIKKNLDEEQSHPEESSNSTETNVQPQERVLFKLGFLQRIAKAFKPSEEKMQPLTPQQRKFLKIIFKKERQEVSDKDLVSELGNLSDEKLDILADRGDKYVPIWSINQEKERRKQIYQREIKKNKGNIQEIIG